MEFACRTSSFDFVALWMTNAKRFECWFLHFLFPFSPSFHAAIPSEAIPVLGLCTLHQHWLIDSLNYRKLHATMCWLLDMELFMEWTMSGLSLWQHECTLRLIDIRPGNPCGMSAAFVACSLDATIFSSFWMFFLTCSFFVELFKELDLDSLILVVCIESGNCACKIFFHWHVSSMCLHKEISQPHGCLLPAGEVCWK